MVDESYIKQYNWYQLRLLRVELTDMQRNCLALMLVHREIVIMD